MACRHVDSPLGQRPLDTLAVQAPRHHHNPSALAEALCGELAHGAAEVGGIRVELDPVVRMGRTVVVRSPVLSAEVVVDVNVVIPLSPRGGNSPLIAPPWWRLLCNLCRTWVWAAGS